MNALIPTLRRRIADTELRIVNCTNVLGIQKRQEQLREDKALLEEVEGLVRSLRDIAGKAQAGREAMAAPAKHSFLLDILAMAEFAIEFAEVGD